MPSFISVDGVWTAAKEKVSDSARGIEHDGPDREAIKFIAQEKGISVAEAIKENASIGMPASEDPEMFEVAKKHGFNSVEDYLKAKKPTVAQEAEIKKARSKVVTHKDEPRKPGVDTGTKGGFYDGEKSDPIKEFNKKD